MKRVLIVNNLLGYHGAENVLKNFVNHLDKKKYDVTVLTLQESSRELLDNDVKYKFIFKKGNSILDKIGNKIKLILGYEKLAHSYCKGYDIAIAFKMGESAKLVGYSSCEKKYCWIHSNVSALDEEYSYSFGSLEEEKSFLKRFDAMVAVSEFCKKSFMKKYGETIPVSVILNPVDVEDIKKKSKEKFSDQEDMFMGGDEPVIGTVARMDEDQKKISRLINISFRLKKEGIGHKLVLIGDGPDYRNYQDEILKKNGNQIYLCGFQKNPYKYLAKFDLFICSSRWESYSIVVNEALVLGIPVISTRCGGPEEVLEQGRWGELTENTE